MRTVAAGAGWEPARVRRATELVVLDFPAEDTHCPQCGARMRVLKSRKRRVVTLAQGAFMAREIQRVCRAEVHPRPLLARSSALARLVPSYQRYGWDLIVHVGLRRSLLYRQRRELQQELREEHGIEVSAGTLSALSDRFLLRLETLHRARARQLRAAMDSEGGYSLHIDSTNETGRGGLFLCVDGIRGWVLNSGNIASERWESLAPIVAQTVTLFGDPVATVSDMSKACARALAPLTDRGIPNFICHYHFVADIGADLMRRLHDRLKAHLKIARVSQQVRGLLSCLKVEDGQDPAGPQRYQHHQLAALLYWILHGNGRKTPRFPFGLPHLELFDRLQSAPSRAEQWVPRPWHPRVETAVEKLDSIARGLEEDHDTCDLVHELRQRWQLFDELRQILRLEADVTASSAIPSSAARTDRSSISSRAATTASSTSSARTSRDCDGAQGAGTWLAISRTCLLRRLWSRISATLVTWASSAARSPTCRAPWHEPTARPHHSMAYAIDQMPT